MTAIELGNEIISTLREIEGTDVAPGNIEADDKIPPDVFPAIRVAYLGTETEPVNLREAPSNDPASIYTFTYRFNIRVVAEAYIVDGDGFFADSAAPGLVEKIKALPVLMFSADSCRRVTWRGWTSGEYTAEETEPRPYVDMGLAAEMIRSI